MAFSPARRRPPHPRRRAGRGRQAGGARNQGRCGVPAPPALSRERRAGGPGRAARHSAPRAKAPASGSDAGAHSWRVSPLGRFVELRRRSDRPHQRKRWGGARRTVGRLVWLRPASRRPLAARAVASAAAASGSDAGAGDRARVAAVPLGDAPGTRSDRASRPARRPRPAPGGVRRGRSPAASCPPNRSGACEP